MQMTRDAVDDTSDFTLARTSGTTSLAARLKMVKTMMTSNMARLKHVVCKLVTSFCCTMSSRCCFMVGPQSSPANVSTNAPGNFQRQRNTTGSKMPSSVRGHDR